MEQEEKQLLLRDLCARLPYGVFINFEKTHNIFPLVSIKMEEMFPLNDFQVLLNDKYPIQWCKPYLCQMSSMTDEELVTFLEIKGLNLKSGDLQTFREGQTAIVSILPSYSRHIDWLNAHRFDHRGLIKKGLALEAPEGMY